MSIDPVIDPDLEAFTREVASRVPDDVEVVPTGRGFDVSFREKFVMAGVASTVTSAFRSQVTCDAASLTFTMLDFSTSTRVANTGARASAATRRGRINAMRMVDTYGQLPDGSIGKTGTMRQDTKTIHTAVRGAAEALGWMELEPTEARIGKLVAIIGGVGGLVAAVTIAVLALMGKFD